MDDKWKLYIIIEKHGGVKNEYKKKKEFTTESKEIKYDEQNNRK